MLLAAFAFLICLAADRSVAAQSAVDGFDPNTDTNGTVFAVATQADGKVIIGGAFLQIMPNGGPTVTRHRIARLNPDGTLDAAFDPNIGGGGQVVFAIVIQPDGKILVGGSFTTVAPNGVGSVTRNNIVRLNTDGTVDPGFDPNASAGVRSIALDSSGRVLVGGDFTGANSIGGLSRNNIARLDGVTGAPDSFNPGSNGSVFSIVLQPDGKILVGGNFDDPSGTATNIGGASRNHIARLDPATGLADSFNPNAQFGDVYSIALQPDGNIVLGGGFTAMGGQFRIGMARVSSSGALDASFIADTNNRVASVVLQSDGKILVGGDFSTIGGVTRNFMARLTSSGAVDAFNPNPNRAVAAIAQQQDGKILVGGFFDAFNGGATGSRNNIARLERDGRLDQTLNLSMVGSFVFATAIQPDGRVLIGGRFTQVLGVARNNIARLNADGTLDLTFNPNANSDVYTISVQSDGKILVGGFFTNIGATTRNRIARLDAVTGLADSFDPNANSEVDSIAVQADGKILAGGLFTNIGATTRNRIARLDATTGLADSFDPNANNSVLSIVVQSDGKILASGGFSTIGAATRNFIARLDAVSGLADSFNPNPNNFVQAIALQSDGKILAGGIFTTIGGQTRNRIARLDAATGAADSWNPNANNGVYSIAVQSDGKVVAGGEFTNIGGQPRNFIARLDALSGLGDSFNPNADDIVQSIAVQSDGKILAGGIFTNIGGQSRSLFARLTNDTAALSTLTVTRTTLTLTRTGSGPQFTRVTFERSTDNGVTYTPLGNGTPSAPTSASSQPSAPSFQPPPPASSTYTLTGLNLPTTQNILIRARGYYRSGFQGGSETTEDKVQLAFLQTPTAAGVSVSGRVLTSDGRGLRNATVVLIDEMGNAQRVRTSSLGSYQFAGISVGRTYVMAIESNTYRYLPRLISLDNAMSGLDFVPVANARGKAPTQSAPATVTRAAPTRH